MSARKQFSNIHKFSVFGELWFIISAHLLGFVLIRCLFFLSVAGINKFPFFNTLGTLVRVNLPRCASGKSESFTKEHLICKAQ